MARTAEQAQRYNAQQRAMRASRRPARQTCAGNDCGASLRVDNKLGFCGSCAELNPHIAKQRRLDRYGMSVAQFDAMLQKQAGKCATCDRSFRNSTDTQVDHDHQCCPGYKSCGSCVRALLCSNCNTALGLLRDDVSLLMNCAAYLLSTRSVLGQVI